MIYPLNPPLMEVLILPVIARGDSYGYQISQQLKTVSDLKDSALYPVLKRLTEKGYVRVFYSRKKFSCRACLYRTWIDRNRPWTFAGIFGLYLGKEVYELVDKDVWKSGRKGRQKA